MRVYYLLCFLKGLSVKDFIISVFIGFVIIGFVMYVQCSLIINGKRTIGWNIHARIKNRKNKNFSVNCI